MLGVGDGKIKTGLLGAVSSRGQEARDKDVRRSGNRAREERRSFSLHRDVSQLKEAEPGIT